MKHKDGGLTLSNFNINLQYSRQYIIIRPDRDQWTEEIIQSQTHETVSLILDENAKAVSRRKDFQKLVQQQLDVYTGGKKAKENRKIKTRHDLYHFSAYSLKKQSCLTAKILSPAKLLWKAFRFQFSPNNGIYKLSSIGLISFLTSIFTSIWSLLTIYYDPIPRLLCAHLTIWCNNGASLPFLPNLPLSSKSFHCVLCKSCSMICYLFMYLLLFQHFPSSLTETQLPIPSHQALSSREGCLFLHTRYLRLWWLGLVTSSAPLVLPPNNFHPSLWKADSKEVQPHILRQMTCKLADYHPDPFMLSQSPPLFTKGGSSLPFSDSSSSTQHQNVGIPQVWSDLFFTFLLHPFP